MTINVFVNLASNEIYMSRIDDKGLKDIQTYKLFDDTGNGEQPVATAAPVPAIDLSEIYNRFDRLEGLLSPATTANAKKTPANKEATANA
jgi:hypothetical protein